MPEMIRPEFIEPAMTAKTKASVLRQMAALAGKTGRVSDPPSLLQGLEAREELCSTGIPGGLALLHSRNPESYLFERRSSRWAARSSKSPSARPMASLPTCSSSSAARTTACTCIPWPGCA